MLQTIEASQADLMRRIALRDKHALGEFYDLTATPLYSIAYKILGNAQEAEDVIQDVFLIIWNKAVMYDESKGRAFQWALALTRNRALDSLRARNRRSKVFVDVDENQEMNQVSNTIQEFFALENHDIVLIQNAVNALPDDQRQAIELAFFSGHSHQEIAEVLNEPLGTIKARIRRGMFKLREVLKNYL